MPRLSKSYIVIARWSFIVLASLTVFLFWKIVEPWALTLLTALIVAVVLGPLDRTLRQHIASPTWRAVLLVSLTLLTVIIPLFAALVGILSQAADLIQNSLGDEGWLRTFDLHSSPLFLALPPSVQAELLSVDFAALVKTAAQWALVNVGAMFASTAQLLFKTFVFFIALFYLIVDRDALRARVLALSPFQNKLDESIIHRMTNTVRSVVLSAIVVSILKGILAAIGMTIFGVPGALLWGAVTIVAAQVPMLGAGLVMVPACVYLFATGQMVAGVGLMIWAFVLVGLTDNILSPYILKGRTNMHPLLILISIIGGLQVFGPVGFIVGPVVLAALMVVIDLYEGGILEHGA